MTIEKFHDEATGHPYNTILSLLYLLAAETLEGIKCYDEITKDDIRQLISELETE